MASATPEPSKSKKPRGPYKARAKLAEIADDELDALLKHDSALVPQNLEIRKSDDGALPVVRIGSLTEDSTISVYYQPYWVEGSGAVRGRFVTLQDRTSKTKNEDQIEFAHANLKRARFNTDSAVSRFSTKDERGAKWKDWLLFVWKQVTGEQPPSGKSSAAGKRKRTIKIEQADESAKPAKIAKKTLKRRGEEDDSEVKRPVKDAFDLWEAYNQGTFDVSNKRKVQAVCRAHRILFKGDSHPKPSVLVAAYTERVKSNLTSCDMTNAWLAFRTRACGSDAETRADFTEYASFSAEKAASPEEKPTPEEQRADGGREQRAQDGVIPSEEEAYRIVIDWQERGRNIEEDGIEGVRVAKQIIETAAVQRWREEKKI